VAHQKDITKNRSQPRGLLHRKLKIQRTEGNFGDEEQGLRVTGGESREWKSMPNSIWKEVQDKRGGVIFDVVKSYSRENSNSAGTTINNKTGNAFVRRLYFCKGFILIVINDPEFIKAIVVLQILRLK